MSFLFAVVFVVLPLLSVGSLEVKEATDPHLLENQDATNPHLLENQEATNPHFLENQDATNPHLRENQDTTNPPIRENQEEVLGVYRFGTQEPVYRFGTQEPVYRSGTQEPVYRPGSQEPVYRSGTQEPVYRSGTQEPVYRSGTQEPIYRSGTQEPVYRSGTQEPVYRSGTQEPAVELVYTNAKSKMEAQFLYLVSEIAGKVDGAVESIKEDLTAKNAKTQTFGAALVAGGFKDALSDFVENNRAPLDIITMSDVTYTWGYNIGYGFGFAAPFLLPSYLSDTNLDCSSNDFLRVVSEYGLAYGLNHKGEANMWLFGLDAKVALHCVLQHSGDYAEAAEIGYLIDDAVSAGVAATRLNGY